jgi:hypothetical protein
VVRVREISENDLRWFAARLLIAIKDTRRYGGMSVHELKQALRDVSGAESLTLGYAPNGDELVTIAGRTVTVRPGASNAEIALAFREPATSTPNVSVTPLPPIVAYAPAPTIPPQTRTKSMSTPNPGSFAAGIRAMMDEARAGVAKARADGLAKVGDAVGKLNDAKVATAHVAGAMAQTIENEAADVMAELGQISNDLGGNA